MSDRMNAALIVSFPLRRRSRVRVLQWAKEEWHKYADPKWDDVREDHDVFMEHEGVGPEGWWFNQTLQYMGRAHALGLDTPNGRQHLMKGLTTYIDMCASMVRVYGDPPKAGYPSGEVHV